MRLFRACLLLFLVIRAATEVALGVVQIVETHEELKSTMAEAGPRPLIVMFWTEKCGFCHMMMPLFEQTALKYGDRAHFRKINSRTNPVSAEALKADGLPNFKFILRGKVEKDFKGASAEALEKYTSKVVDLADADDVVVTRADLILYFEVHDKDVAASPESIDWLLETGKTSPMKLIELLEGQYGARPRFTGGFIESPQLPVVFVEAPQERHTEQSPVAAADAGPNPCSAVRQKGRGVQRVVILGGGPAGASAALYASRSLLCPLVIAPRMGGQLMAKGVDVENYPGIPRAMGGKIVNDMRAQAEMFHAEFLDDVVVSASLSSKPFVLKSQNSGRILADSIIIATGAISRVLGVPGETELYGHGVSGCATCDGYTHRGKQCLVVGGGDAALEDALHLTRICSSVTLVHRRNHFRASRGVSMSVLHDPAIVVRWDTEVVEFRGSAGTGLQAVVLRSAKTGVVETLQVQAAFVAIGHDPNTQMFRGQLQMDQASGYIGCINRTTHTSVPGVFAAGDVADSRYRQAVTSAGSGAAAALDAEKWLAEQAAPGSANSHVEATPSTGHNLAEQESLQSPQSASAPIERYWSAAVFTVLLIGITLGRFSNNVVGKTASEQPLDTAPRGKVAAPSSTARKK